MSPKLVIERKKRNKFLNEITKVSKTLDPLMSNF
jgi:hypothetical protein